METREGLEIYHLVFQEKDLLQTTINTVVCRLLLLVEDDIVLLDGVLNHIGRYQRVIWALHSTSASSTYEISVRKTPRVFRSLSSPRIQASLSWVGNEA